jgi:hypothetical protein
VGLVWRFCSTVLGDSVSVSDCDKEGDVVFVSSFVDT